MSLAFAQVRVRQTLAIAPAEGRVNKTELIDAIAKAYDGNRKEAKRALDAITDVVTRAMASGEKVVITGFGVFERVDRAARTARNPRTGAPISLAKVSVPKFRPGSDLKAVVSGARKLPKQAQATAQTVQAEATATARHAAEAALGAPAKATATARQAAEAALETATKATSPGRKATTSTATKAPAKTTATTAPATKAATKKAATKSTPTKAAAKSTASKSAATKSTARKAPARKAATKSAGTTP
jgi:DNA-binding protein HU-beta